jgi:hypothetical protein
LEAVLWILNTGAQWHMLPQCYPNYKTVHRRFQQWCDRAVLREILTQFANTLREERTIDERESFIDATFASAKGGGDDIGPTRRGKRPVPRRSAAGPRSGDSPKTDAPLSAPGFVPAPAHCAGRPSASGGGSWPHLFVAFFEFQCEFTHQLLQAGILVVEPRFTVGLLGHLKRLGSIREKLIAPLVILRLPDVVILTNGRDGFPPEAFEHDGRFRFRVPLPSLHG